MRKRLSTPQAGFKFLSQLPRRVCAMAVQLKSGHFPTKSYLYRFKQLQINVQNATSETIYIIDYIRVENTFDNDKN